MTIYGYHEASRTYWRECLDDIREAGEVAVGVELEVVAEDGRNALAHEVHCVDPEILAENDSSLPSGGVEFIGYPQPLSDIGTTHDTWAQVCPAIYRGGGRAWAYEACGMHVTVDDYLLSQTARALIVLACHTWVHVPNLAGRDSDGWAHRMTGLSLQDAESLVRLGRTRTGIYAGRYNAVNLLRGAGNGMEIRIFKANVRWEGFARVMRWVRSLVTYAQQCENCPERFNEAEFLLRFGGATKPKPRWNRESKIERLRGVVRRLAQEERAALDSLDWFARRRRRIESVMSRVNTDVHSLREEAGRVVRRNIASSDAAWGDTAGLLGALRVEIEGHKQLSVICEEWLETAREIEAWQATNYQTVAQRKREVARALLELEDPEPAAEVAMFESSDFSTQALGAFA